MHPSVLKMGKIYNVFRSIIAKKKERRSAYG